MGGDEGGTGKARRKRLRGKIKVECVNALRVEEKQIRSGGE